MKRRQFFKNLFKVTAVAIAAPIVVTELLKQQPKNVYEFTGPIKEAIQIYGTLDSHGDISPKLNVHFDHENKIITLLDNEEYLKANNGRVNMSDLYDYEKLNCDDETKRKIRSGGWVDGPFTPMYKNTKPY